MAGRGRPRRVLLVEDNSYVRVGIRRLLERAGYEVMEAVDGTGGVQVLRENQVDVILTDLYMPDMNGIELIAAARAMQPDIPIVAMSGYSVDHVASLLDAALLGAVVTLQKPFKSGTLLDALAQVCAGDEQREAGGESG